LKLKTSDILRFKITDDNQTNLVEHYTQDYTKFTKTFLAAQGLSA